MTNEELDEARADEGRRIWDEMGRPDEVRPGWIVARLAREAAEARIAELEARIAELEAALAMADQLCRVALPQFNWAASALDGQAILILNEAPGIIRRALMKEPDQ
jgi:hypothetical protein